MRPLGRVLDPEELERAEGASGKIVVGVPAGWLTAGETIEIVVPVIVTCARCEGGGCDGCGRSGGLRLSGEESARTFELPLPKGRGEHLLVRMASPLGDGAGLDWLRVEIRSAATAAGCRRQKGAGWYDRVMRSPRRPTMLVVAGLVVIALAAVALMILTRPAKVVIEQPPPRKEPSLPPGRRLETPASTKPESVDRRTLTVKETQADAPGAGEGLVTTLTITTPPFEIKRRYRSMEGPFAEYTVRIDGAAAAAHDRRELLWWKGAKIEVLDESGKPLGQEFMCHLNLDVNGDERLKALGQAPGSKRLLTLTQGELSFALPKGRGVPTASDESWSMMFQVLNHNRDGAFRVRQRLTLYFLRDADLFAPVDAVSWYAGSIWVPVDKTTPDALALDKTACHCCAPLDRGLEATNSIVNARLVDDTGRTLVGHWVVPPGKRTWSYPLVRYLPTADKARTLVATWTHVHPFATEVRLVSHAPGCAPEVVAKSTIESLAEGKIGLTRIRSFASEAGAELAKNAKFELAVDYDNASGRPQDSMTSLGMFVDSEWTRPAWAIRAKNESGMDGSCGLQE